MAACIPRTGARMKTAAPRGPRTPGGAPPPPPPPPAVIGARQLRVAERDGRRHPPVIVSQSLGVEGPWGCTIRAALSPLRTLPEPLHEPGAAAVFGELHCVTVVVDGPHLIPGGVGEVPAPSRRHRAR